MRNGSRVLVVRLTALSVILCLAGPAAAQSGRQGFRGGFYLGVLYSSVSGPTFRFPSGGEQLSVSQTKGVPSFIAGYDLGSGYFGIGIRGTYFSAGFRNFATPDMPGSVDYVGYASPKYSIVMADILLHWAPARSNIFSIYGFVGLGGSSKSYTVSNSVFPEWNGAKSLTEFEYSYGLGLRIRPTRFVAVFGDVRLIPGDQTLVPRNYLYSDGTYDYYQYADTYTSHFTTVISGGLSIHF